MNYAQLNDRLVALSLREKLMVIFAGAFIVLYGGYLLILEPASAAREQITQLTQSQKAELATTIERLQNLRPQDPDAGLQRRKAEILEQLNHLNLQLESQTSELIPAQAMKTVLQELLAQSDSLKVIELTSIAPVLLQPTGQEAEDNSEEEPEVGVYRHGIKLVLEGEYFQIRDYLKRLESLRWRLYWQGFDYEVLEYPQARITLELGTLSTGKAFLGV
ncbi:type II secretion system protein GspM [Aliiglaciecola sp. CAU 1673]|uniref:type II secretion system protein GspM n=1 Tax=Aliiglaciecola sp. CAU 1673 TaxID=3032595 RepID=UPI0023DB8475|nr:type II secretion system protein GspM [Aliiglaciecola sp. CAU 1673]MDF2179143.1 type II secretion system protein GspM [Aliiglaciecola sp. CAU 1673]